VGRPSMRSIEEAVNFGNQSAPSIGRLTGSVSSFSKCL
jgi:hypothetical protein